MKEIAKQNDWVRIEQIILKPDQRLASLPEATRSQPLKCWINGFLQDDEAALGDEVQIKTNAGRVIEGRLFSVWPNHVHSFGRQQQTLINIGRELKELMEVESDE